MKDIKIASIPDCPNCKHLKMLLDKENIPYSDKTYDSDNEDDIAEMSYLGIYSAQFPVVWLNGERLPALTLSEYMERIRA